ncbi:MAG: hypothetical protein WBX16_20910 [Candidatus Acidiferrales bacterium]
MQNLLVGIFILSMAVPAFAQKLAVKIINRQDSETEYTYVVPGYSSSNSNTNVNCSDTGSDVNCNGSTHTSGLSTPAHEVSFTVRGATYSLQLPDGRVAVVNCESKFAEHMAGRAGNHRSCRMPIVDDIQAEFSGDKAKLIWPVSIDGKKMASETYKILGVLSK